jgi:hypothetical protein
MPDHKPVTHELDQSIGSGLGRQPAERRFARLKRVVLEHLITWGAPTAYPEISALLPAKFNTAAYLVMRPFENRAIYNIVETILKDIAETKIIVNGRGHFHELG